MGKHRTWSTEEVDKLILLKFGGMVDSPFHLSYINNENLGKLFKCSA